MDSFETAVNLAIEEMNWAITQARDNGTSEDSLEVYRLFATTFARDPFIMAQITTQAGDNEFMLDPENIAMAKQLFEMTINIRVQLEAKESGSWNEICEIIAASVQAVINTEMLTAAAVERMDINFTQNAVMVASVLFYYAVRRYNHLLTQERPA